jgi:hypothetical protein
MSSTNRSRKYESGYQKRKKKQRIEELTQSQKGAMDRFVIKEFYFLIYFRLIAVIG